MTQIQEETQIIRICLKWNAKVFDELPLDLNAPLIKFKTLVKELTGVGIQKQKIIFKGVTWKENQDLLKIPQLKQGSQLMLIGASEENQIQIDNTKVKFLEDLTPEQVATMLKEKEGIILPIGLRNLGNTCYMNSSIQILRKVHELREFLLNNENVNGNAQNVALFQALRDLMLKLENKGQPFEPMRFLSVLFKLFPEFAQRQDQNSYKQQDADECFQNILSTIEPLTKYEDIEGNQRNLIKDMFEIQMKSTFVNSDNPDESKVGDEKFKKLMCIIDNQNNPVNTLIEGITASLEEQMQKQSDLDGQQHIFKKTVRVNKLPSYLLVQMVRFYWKPGHDGKEGVKAKILRNVAFPKILDLFDFCTPELQQQLQAGRDLEKKQLLEYQSQEQDQLEQFKQNMEKSGQMVPDDTREIYKKFKSQQKENDLKKRNENLYKKHGFGLETGNYELIGVLTHQGREADSGHYMAWVHHSGDDWLCYNDDVVSETKIEKILELRGGGDWHMGYYLLYRKLEVE